MLNTVLPSDLTVLLLDVQPRKLKARPPKICMQMFVSALCMIAKNVETTQILSTDESINKMRYIHTVKRHLSVIKNVVLIHALTWISLENIYVK